MLQLAVPEERLWRKGNCALHLFPRASWEFANVITGGEGGSQGRNLKQPSAIYLKEQRETDVFVLIHASLLATLRHFSTPNPEKGAAYTKQVSPAPFPQSSTDMPGGQPGLNNP